MCVSLEHEGCYKDEVDIVGFSLLPHMGREESCIRTSVDPVGSRLRYNVIHICMYI